MRRSIDLSQPDPKATDTTCSWDLVVADMKRRYKNHPAIADMMARDEYGYQHYGVRLQPRNGRDQLKDAYAELLDGAVYIRSYMYEHGLEYMAEYEKILALVVSIRKFIDVEEDHVR